jgi:CheR methyltransferase, SAM binding domain
MRLCAVGVLLLIAAVRPHAVAPARFVRFGEARAILTELAGRLPPELAALTSTQLEGAWPRWIERHDRDIRARLEQGDEDTIVNWMLFGTSFTSKPRALLGAVESGAAGNRELVLRRTIELISARIDDLLTALAAPGNDERRLFARAFLERKGLRFVTAADKDAAREYLRAAVVRVANEQEQIDQELAATSGRDPKTEFVDRSRLFRTRGLSLDTSILANYSIEQAVAAMKARGLLAPGGVRRVAIVGPGLDFADKDVGFDIYPQQTLQPFAVLDSLKRLGVASLPNDPEIVLFDISPRIVDHVTRARARAAKNVGYTMNLPLATKTPWLPEVRAYWRTFGDQIGVTVQANVSKTIADQAAMRTIRARPSVVQSMSVVNLNVVTERLDGEPFDLVIATNVFIYYDVLEQALAMSNIEAMLKPGAFLLANVSVPNLTSVTIRPVDTTTTVYARAPDVAENVLDFVVWYKAHAN